VKSRELHERQSGRNRIGGWRRHRVPVAAAATAAARETLAKDMKKKRYVALQALQRFLLEFDRRRAIDCQYARAKGPRGRKPGLGERGAAAAAGGRGLNPTVSESPTPGPGRVRRPQLAASPPERRMRFPHAALVARGLVGGPSPKNGGPPESEGRVPVSESNKINWGRFWNLTH
jgi:hypothetical protein